MNAQMKQRETARKLELIDEVKGWREVADSLYARAVYARVIQPIEQEGLSYIADQLNHLKIPKVRGAGRWGTSDVSRLLARVAAMANDATRPQDWPAKMDALTADLGEA